MARERLPPTTVPVRSVTGASTPSVGDRDEDEDPLAMTPLPLPTRSRRHPNIQTSPSISHTSTPSIGSSRTGPRSTTRAGRAAKPKTKLRSGKRLKVKEDTFLREGDLIPPSDDEEYERWVELAHLRPSRLAQGIRELPDDIGGGGHAGMEAESSTMAQERAARQLQSRSPSPSEQRVS
jgi:hypothetical protein